MVETRARPVSSDEALISDTTRAVQTVVEERSAQLAQVASDIRSQRPLLSAAVTGRLLCDGEPANGVELKLYDNDSKFAQA